MAGAAAAAAGKGGDAPPKKRTSFVDEARLQANPFREFQLQVVVLAGGSTPRLSALTETSISSLDDVEIPSRCCKALLPVANRPMIWYILRSLQESRFGDVIVVTQEKDQEELVTYLREEFAEGFQRLEVVGLGREKKKQQQRRLLQQQQRGDSSSYGDANNDDSAAAAAARGAGGKGVAAGSTAAAAGGVAAAARGVAAAGGVTAGEGEEEEESLEQQQQQQETEGSDGCYNAEVEEEEERGETDEEEDEDSACGTAEALQHIKHLLYTDFFVLPCDIIGHVDFYALANVHRVENAACSVYLLPRNCLEQQQQQMQRNKGAAAGLPRKKKNDSFTQQQQQQSSSNAVAVAFADRQLLAWQDRRSIQHGARLKIPKLSLFYHPSMDVRPNLYDPHIYIFKHSVLQLFNSRRFREAITSIRFDLIPYMTLMQESPVATIWSTSRLDSHVYRMLLDSFEKEGQHHSPGSSSSRRGGASRHHLDAAAKTTEEYTVANRPPRPHNGHRVMFALHPENGGLSCRANTLEDYFAANMKFCGIRTDELKGLVPEFMQPLQPSKRPPGTRDSVLGEGVTVEESAVLKRSVIGADVRIAAAARITTSVVMEAAAVGEAAVLQQCIVGKRAVIGAKCKLTNCQVRHGYTVPPNTVAEDETLPSYLNTSDAATFL